MSDSAGTQRAASLVSRRKFLEGLAMAGASGGAGLALGQVLVGPPSAFASPPSDVDPASYIVYKDSSGNIDAVNGNTGSVDNSGTNATTVVQFAINQLTNGSVYVRDGTGTLGTLTHKSGVTVIQETQGSFKFLNGSPAVKTKAGVPADADFGTAVDGLLETNTSNNQLYLRSSGTWRSIANGSSLSIASLLYPSATIIYDVPSLMAALNTTTPIGGEYVILPNVYDLGSGQIVLGQNGVGVPEMNIIGIPSKSSYGPKITSAINGSVFTVAGHVSQRTPFMQDIMIVGSNNGSGVACLEFQQGLTGILDNLFLATTNSANQIGLKLGGGSTVGQGTDVGFMYRIHSIADISLYVNSYFDRMEMIGCDWVGGFFGNGAGIRTVAGAGGSLGSKCVGCYIEGQSNGIGADLNGVSPGGFQTSDFSFIGCSFSNWGIDINVGNANLHAKLIGCETKGYGTFDITGPGTVDVISCYETNLGITTTRRYGNPAPALVAVGQSPFVLPNSLPAPNGQYCALIVYWFGGTVSSVTVGGVQIANSSPGSAILQPGDALVITYSAAPTMVQQQRLLG